jgi:hypothetical protein
MLGYVGLDPAVGRTFTYESLFFFIYLFCIVFTEEGLLLALEMLQDELDSSRGWPP